MTVAFDQRIMTVTISTTLPLPAGQQGPTQEDTLVFTSTGPNPGLDIRAHGRQFVGTTMGEAVIRITNMTREQRNALLTRATPIIPVNGNRNPTYVTLDVGRESYGTFRLFEGACWASAVTAAPDMGVVLTSLTNSILASTVLAQTEGLLTSVSDIVRKICSLYGWTPRIQLGNPDRQISNFQFTGGAQLAIQKLADIGDLTVFLNNNVLTVIDKGAYIGPPAPISLQNGMVGIPQANEWGVEVRTLVRPDIQLGGAIGITSQTNPSVNGTWTIYQLEYDVTNRDDPFWYTVFGKNSLISAGGA